MNKKSFILPILLLIAVCGFAQEEDFGETDFQGIDFEATAIELQESDVQEPEAQEPETQEPEAQEPERVIPASILNNQYYLQSIRYNEQAKEAFEEGDYDASALYAERAAEYARLSDEYVNMRLAETAFARAHSRYTWAGSVGAATRYPSQYRTATAAYNEAVAARQGESWNAVFDSSNRVLAALADVTGPDGEAGSYASALPPKPTQSAPPPVRGTLPAQYTVRQWFNTGDCFSTIAGWDWVYGDATEWRRLYDANKGKIPNPDNPHLILPGMILDIPSLHGETRSGMWEPAGN